MGERIRITEVSPRDGLQNEPGVIPTAEKVRLVRLLIECGFDEIEVSSFVSPKWVPQLADAAAVFRGLVDVFGRRMTPSPSEGVSSLAPSPSGGGQGRGSTLSTSSPPPQSSPPLRTPRNPQSVERARDLRRRMTYPEVILWQRLRGDQVHGLRFRRQLPIGPYIADFVCPALRLIIEVDGRSHDGPLPYAKDKARAAYLEGLGYRIIRYTNDDVLRNADGVVGSIRHVVERMEREWGEEKKDLEDGGGVGGVDPLPSPPPEGEGVGKKRLPLLSALVPNEKGLVSALAVNDAAGFGLIGKVSVFTAASETFSRKNTNASIAETIERFRPVVDGAHARGLVVRGYVSCVIACPFEGVIEPGAVARVAEQLVGIGVDEIDVGDTIGHGTAETVGAMIEAVQAALGDAWRRKITLHLHDTRMRAAECVRRALELGIVSFDGSAAGLGGCPYASTPGKRAPGNIATETLVRTVEDAGYRTRVDRQTLSDAAGFARQIVQGARLGTRDEGTDVVEL